MNARATRHLFAAGRITCVVCTVRYDDPSICALFVCLAGHRVTTQNHSLSTVLFQRVLYESVTTQERVLSAPLRSSQATSPSRHSVAPPDEPEPAYSRHHRNAKYRPNMPLTFRDHMTISSFAFVRDVCVVCIDKTSPTPPGTDSRNLVGCCDHRHVNGAVGIQYASQCLWSFRAMFCSWQ